MVRRERYMLESENEATINTDKLTGKCEYGLRMQSVFKVHTCTLENAIAMAVLPTNLPCRARESESST